MVILGETLGVIAGEGELPLAIAAAARNNGRQVFVLALEGMVRAGDVASFPHKFVSLGQVGTALTILKDAKVSEVTFAGKVARPQFGAIKFDARGAMALPGILAAARKGDDALLRAVLALFEKEGFRIIGSADAARDLLAFEGPFGDLEPTDDELRDVARAIEVVRAMGAQDIGQAAVVCDGLVLAVEAAEGTDEMLKRVAGLPEPLRGTAARRRGVMVKAAKPAQDRRVDLPVVGRRTVELAAAAGLSGIAVEARATLVLDQRAVTEAADLAGIFVFGFAGARK